MKSNGIIPDLIGVELPLTPPEYGAKTAQAILDVVRLHPDRHDQSKWILTDAIRAQFPTQYVNDKTCGTVMCVAGWAQFLHEGAVYETTDGSQFDAEYAGALYLGLGAGEAHELFYATSNAGAVKALEYLARGEPIDWDAVETVEMDVLT